MATATRTIGPADAGLAMTWEEYCSSQFEDGHRYELIDGRLVVAATPNAKHSICWDWLNGSLTTFRRSHPEVINHVTAMAAVFVPNRPGETVPEPDLAAFHDFPNELVFADEIDWRRISPILVAEIVSPDTPDKDLFRNVTLYELVPSIREYWIVDARGGLEDMLFRVYRKRGAKWQKPIDLGYGDTYTTKLLPDFSLLIDPLA